MHSNLRPSEYGPDRTLRDALAAVRQVQARHPGSRALYGYGPVARVNPFQALLYSSFPDEGLAVSPVYGFDTIPVLNAIGAQGYSTFFHLHWTSPVLEGAIDEADAAERVDAFLGVLDEFVGKGGRLLWTVHNVFPHDAAFREQETRLQRGIVERCWRVHTMSKDTPERLADVSPVPAEKVLYSPHPAYHGAYPSYMTREEARLTLGIEPGEIVLTTFGAIKAYKGLARMLDVLEESWDHDAPWRLVLAGGPDKDEDTQRLVRRAGRHPQVIVHARKAPAEEVQTFLRAADVALVPYERSLNSGYLLLALTFGLPAIAPRGGGPADVVTPEVGLLFDATSKADLARCLHELPRLLTDDARHAARQRADQYDARLISAELAQRILKESVG